MHETAKDSKGGNRFVPSLLLEGCVIELSTRVTSEPHCILKQVVPHLTIFLEGVDI